MSLQKHTCLNFKTLSMQMLPMFEAVQDAPDAPSEAFPPHCFVSVIVLFVFALDGEHERTCRGFALA